MEGEQWLGIPQDLRIHAGCMGTSLGVGFLVNRIEVKYNFLESGVKGRQAARRDHH